MAQSRDHGIAERLQEALAHFSPRRRSELRRRLDEQAWEGGFKGGIAMLAGLPTPSVLSDMLSGRARGLRHLAGLAEILGVDEAWLTDGGGEAPDWTLAPEAAFDRWSRRLGGALSAWTCEQQGGQSWRPATTLDPRRRQDLAERLALEEDDPLLTRLGERDWAAIPFPLLEAVAAELGLPEPEHIEVIRRGHAIAAAAADDDDAVAAAVARRIGRYRLPPTLFRLARMALASLRQQRVFLKQDTRDIDDTLELLWRDQLSSSGEAPPEIPPAEFTQESGRHDWTPSATIRERNGGA
jgi:hypothetical protein